MNPDPLRSGNCFGKATRTEDPWFPDSAKHYRERKVLCLGCPVMAACLERALASGEEHGVWAGTTLAERRRIRADRKKVDAA